MPIVAAAAVSSANVALAVEVAALLTGTFSVTAAVANLLSFEFFKSVTEVGPD